MCSIMVAGVCSHRLEPVINSPCIRLCSVLPWLMVVKASTYRVASTCNVPMERQVMP